MLLQNTEIKLRYVQPDDIDTIIQLIQENPDSGSLLQESLLHELVEKKYFDSYESPGDNPEAALIITGISGTIIGSISYFKGPRYVEGYELSYHIFHPEHKGKGVAQNAVLLLIDFLFTIKKAPRLQINVLKDNIPSKRVAEKCGFTFDGTMRKAFRSGDILKDIEMFSLLSGEWQLIKKKEEMQRKGEGFV
ncbi:MAG: GNAT family N-acetyltransferase [bacterium]|nr:GNAT family N-acetyltransferase [bacterium]